MYAPPDFAAICIFRSSYWVTLWKRYSLLRKVLEWVLLDLVKYFIVLFQHWAGARSVPCELKNIIEQSLSWLKSEWRPWLSDELVLGLITNLMLTRASATPIPKKRCSNVSTFLYRPGQCSVVLVAWAFPLQARCADLVVTRCPTSAPRTVHPCRLWPISSAFWRI